MVQTQGVIHFSLPVTDLDRSAKFYHELLGMKIVQKTPRMVFLKTGEDYFILAKEKAAVQYASGKALSFLVSGSVALLVNKGLKSMALATSLWVSASLLTMGLLAGGAGLAGAVVVTGDLTLRSTLPPGPL